MDFPARYVLLKPPTPEILQSRLKEVGNKDDAAIQSIIDGLAAQVEDPQVAEIFNRTFVTEDLEEAGKAVGAYVFEKDSEDPMEEDEPTAEVNAEEAVNGGEQMEVEAGSDPDARRGACVEHQSEGDT